MFQTSFIQQGWECPKCNRVYSPTTSMCSNCPQKSQSFTSSGTSITFTHDFSSNTPTPTEKTKCSVCGLEKWQHPNKTYTF